MATRYEINYALAAYKHDLRKRLKQELAYKCEEQRDETKGIAIALLQGQCEGLKTAISIIESD